MLQAAFVTYRKIPDLSDDDRLVIDPLRRIGVEVTAVPWDTQNAGWRRFDAIILRSCWDYHKRIEEFSAWIDEREREDRTAVRNPPAAIRWNKDKSYLQEIQAAGVPVVPTLFLRRGSSASLPRLLDQQAWSHAVVKPSISASAFRTWMTTSATAPDQQTDLDSLLARSGVMIQEYFPEIETAGEWSLIFLDGKHSHTVRKRPRAGDFRVQEELGGTVQPGNLSRSLVDQAGRVFAAAPELAPLLYARVDGLVREGIFFLMELELIEPSLFLGFNPGAPARFAAAIRKTIDNAKGSLDGGDRG